MSQILLTVETTAAAGSGVKPHTHRDQWLVCTAVGGGRPRRLALEKAEQASQLRLVPWAGVCAPLSRDGRPAVERPPGRAYCFLPLPALTGLPVHINGYFELASNRRNIWSPPPTPNQD